MREVVRLDGSGQELSIEIPYPGLADPHSQLGVPLLHAGRMLGVQLVEASRTSSCPTSSTTSRPG